MGGLAGAAGAARLSEPRWLVGGGVVLTVAADTPTLWLVDLDDPITSARAGAVSLTAADRADLARHRDAGERLLRRGLARLLLAVAGGCHPDAIAIERSPAGAPVVTTPAGWHLSLAARWPMCLVGVAPVPLGVDVEAIVEPLPDDLLTEVERHDHLLVGEKVAAQVWAAKEAHAKWTGHPRDLDPAAIETGFPPLVTSIFGTTRCWRRDTAGHVAAVCTA